jgi:hypothetical protein
MCIDPKYINEEKKEKNILYFIGLVKKNQEVE